MTPSIYKVSVVICTFNRAESLREMLGEVCAQKLRTEDKIEILVVDNNSSDHTENVVREFEKKSPWPLQYLFEEQQGVNYARNLGIRQSQGEIVAFIDDDIVLDNGWLQGIIDVFNELSPDAAGGRISPLWLQEPAEWLKAPNVKKDIAGVMGWLDLSDKPFIADREMFNIFYGANMAFKRSVFEEVGFFNPGFGIIGRGRGLAGETELLKRLYQYKKKVAYTPHAHVWHKITPKMMSLGYMRRWKFNKGKSAASRKQRTAFWLYRECFENALLAAWNYLKGKKIIARKLDLRCCIQLGQILGSLKAVS